MVHWRTDVPDQKDRFQREHQTTVVDAVEERTMPNARVPSAAFVDGMVFVTVAEDSRH
ncbi:hypothetical protein M404DRAFT_1005329 [Pisolithus tinctorius Marx 270]|uniref:Uncharacterized protein n=1 Tax=Pisolithus tinctorius Marx 270 TaxID=870435 RepID=A0A0C3NBI0_PISTI|nr:hypothetical protein M404DRAFT_1005329 [Pisolithus tinctorius Marx 270]